MRVVCDLTLQTNTDVALKAVQLCFPGLKVVLAEWLLLLQTSWINVGVVLERGHTAWWDLNLLVTRGVMETSHSCDPSPDS